MGTQAYIDTVPPCETDCLEIGDHAVILFAPQSQVPHSFDRAQLQFAPIKMGKYSSMGVMSCAMLATEIGDYSAVGPASLVTKNEHLEESTYSHGNPIFMERAYHPIAYAEPEPEQHRMCCASWAGAIDSAEEEVRIPLMGPNNAAFVNNRKRYGSVED